MRKIVCTIFLILVYFTNTAMLTVGKERTTTSTQLYEYSDAFTTSWFTSNWTPYNANFTVTTETLVHESTDTGIGVMLINQGKQFIDGTIEVDLKTVSTYERLGIIFRMQDTKNYYTFDVCNSYNTPDVMLKKVVDDTSTQLDSGINSYNSLSTFYTFKVVLSGNSIKTYVDDNLIDDITDDTFSQGYVGLHATRGSGQGVFDNFNMSMTYTDDSLGGLIEDNTDTYETFSYGGWDRGFGSGKTYLCGRSGMIDIIYYQHDSSLDITKTNCGVGTDDIYIAFSDAQGTDIGGGVASYSLVRPILVLKDALYYLDTQCDDTSWNMYGIVDVAISTGHNARSEIDYVGLDEAIVSQSYDNTAGRKLKLWAE
jgi:hypothetical protein